MYQALYRKYRPKTFEDVVGQAHITRTLQKRGKNRKNRSCLFVYRFTGNRQDDLFQDPGESGELSSHAGWKSLRGM